MFPLTLTIKRLPHFEPAEVSGLSSWAIQNRVHYSNLAVKISVSRSTHSKKGDGWQTICI